MNFRDWLKGQEVEDALKDVTISVLERDISTAIANDGFNCVAGKCIQRALGAKDVYFYHTVCYVKFDVNQKVQRFVPSSRLRQDVIRKLDTGKMGSIKPGLYELLAPPPSYKIGVASKNRSARLARGKKTKKRMKFKSRPLLGRMQAAYGGAA